MGGLLSYSPTLILSTHRVDLSLCAECLRAALSGTPSVKKTAVLGVARDCFVCHRAPFLIPQAPATPGAVGWGREPRVQNQPLLFVPAALEMGWGMGGQRTL